MRKYLVIAVSFVSIFLVYSCSDSKGPKAVFLDMMKAIENDDYEKIKSYMTDEEKKKFDGPEGEMMKMSLTMMKGFIKDLKVTDEKIEGNKATITFEITAMGKKQVQTAPMVLQNGKWVAESLGKNKN